MPAIEHVNIHVQSMPKYLYIYIYIHTYIYVYISCKVRCGELGEDPWAHTHELHVSMFVYI